MNHGVNTDMFGYGVTASTDTLGKSNFLTVPALDRMSMIIHAFTTRQNGLGSRVNGIKSFADWAPVAHALAITSDRLVTVNQVHGDTIMTVDETNYRNVRTAHADALVTRQAGIAIGIETADCVPVLLVDPETPAVGAIHAGWRSTVKKIVQKTVNQMRDTFGSDPARMTAAIGPSIGPECYEVDDPVMGPVRQAFSYWKDVAFPRGEGRWSLDLVKTNIRELISAGFQEDNIHALGLCTSCKRDLFYSFRAEGRTGRMLSVIMMKR